MAKVKNNSPRIANRRAFHEYHIGEKLECGIQLTGSEVKSVRDGKVSLAEGYARIDRDNQLYLVDVDIATYPPAPGAHEPKRKRKLLVHKREIAKLIDATSSKGNTLVPIAMYFNERGIIKVEIGVGTGKGRSDKRETLKTKTAERDMRRAMSRKRIG